MTDSKDITKILGFYGKSDKGTEYRMWSTKFLARAHVKGYKKLLLGEETTPVPRANAVLDANDVEGKRLRKANEDAYNDLITVMMAEVCFGKVASATTEALPDGDARLAWTNLIAKYKPRTASRLVELKGDFQNSKLTSAANDPDAWLDELDYIRSQMEALNHTMTDEAYLIHVLHNLPSEYDTVVESGTKELDKQSLTIDQLKQDLQIKYKLIQKKTGSPVESNPSSENAALSAANNGKKFKFKKQFKGNCNKCGKYGHKASDCRSNPNNNQQPRQGTNNKQRFNGKCHNCGKWGHKASDCRNNNGNSGGSANAVHENHALMTYTDVLETDLGKGIVIKENKDTVCLTAFAKPYDFGYDFCDGDHSACIASVDETEDYVMNYELINLHHFHFHYRCCLLPVLNR